MRIAQVSPLYESVPPRLYGGTERIVHYLTEELVRLGHEVTLFASGDSTTAARLVPQCEQALRLDERCVDPLAKHLLMLERITTWNEDFDIVHFHTDYLHFSIARRMSTRHVTTLHGRLDISDLGPIYDEFGDVPVVSISDAQRRPLPQAGWTATVHHGLPPDLLRFKPDPEGYFAFVGRISPEKRVDRAIEIAKALDVPLKIAAKVDKVDKEYFETQIQPLFDHRLVEFVAFRNGSVDEVLEDGVSGFVVDSMEEAIEAAGRVRDIDRAGVRKAFDDRFTAERMAKDYLEVYADLCSRKSLQSGITRSTPPEAAALLDGEDPASGEVVAA